MISACSEGLSAVLCFVCPGARFDDGAGGDNEVQRTMLELINQLDGFDPRGNIKVLMATNRPDTLDPALMRPGRLDRKIEFSLPDLEVRMLFFAAEYFLVSVFLQCVSLLSGCSLQELLKAALLTYVKLHGKLGD